MRVSCSANEVQRLSPEEIKAILLPFYFTPEVEVYMTKTYYRRKNNVWRD
jgi:hypothetical protein